MINNGEKNILILLLIQEDSYQHVQKQPDQSTHIVKKWVDKTLR